jgi:Flp pilus assembly protein TadG
VSHQPRRGAAAIEFALTFPFALMLLAGVLDGGMLLADKFAVSRASRDGARVGAMTMEPIPATGSTIAAATIAAAEASMTASGFADGAYQVEVKWSPQGGTNWLEVEVSTTREGFFGDLTPFGGSVRHTFLVVTQEQGSTVTYTATN